MPTNAGQRPSDSSPHVALCWMIEERSEQTDNLNVKVALTRVLLHIGTYLQVQRSHFTGANNRKLSHCSATLQPRLNKV